jgi:hypothetical protein
VQLACRHHVTMKRFHQRVQQLTASPYPVRQRRSFQFDSLARVHLALAIEREMIGILRHQNVRQQSGTGQPTRNRSARSRGLHDLLAMPAAQSRLIRPAPV